MNIYFLAGVGAGGESSFEKWGIHGPIGGHVYKAVLLVVLSL